MKISLCIPVYNEEKILPDTIEQLSRYMSEAFVEDYEIIFVSDGSRDRSPELISAAADASGGKIRAICYEPNRGKGCAVRTALLAAEGEIAIFTDCDLAYGCDVVREFYDRMIAEPELGMLIGSRALHPEGYEGYTAMRRLVSKTYVKVLSVWGGLKLTDSQSGIKAFRRSVARAVFSRCEVDRFAFDFEAILIADAFGVKIGEQPVKIVNHRESTVRIFHDSIEMLRAISRMKKRIRRLPIDPAEIADAESAAAETNADENTDTVADTDTKKGDSQGEK